MTEDIDTEADDAVDGELRVRAATAIRRLSHALLSRHVEPALLQDMAAGVGHLADRVEAGPPRRRPEGGMRADVFDREEVADGAVVRHYEDCPVSGLANPLAAEIVARREGDGVRASVVLGPAFEGAPGRSHGGPVASMFDDVMGFLATVHRVPTYAGELTVRYLAPTPLGEELDVTAWVSERHPRRMITKAEARHRGRTIAEATCIGVIIGEDRLGRPAYEY